MQDFYGPQNTVMPSCKASASIFRKLLTALVGSGKKVIRVLEVGCGTGMLTHHLVDVLPEFPDLVVEYVATDISLGLAMQAAQRFSHPYMRAAAYDLTKTLETQGIAPGSFDVVSALHVLHATADLSQTMNSISDLLVPGGYVLTVDFDGEAWHTGVPGTLWYDFIFGGFQEWFVFVNL
jgi:SAM-dependent methyltransferase